MKLLDILQEIDDSPKDVYLVHERFERHYDMHTHKRDQLSFVEGGVAYVTIENEYLVVPAMHFLWIPAGVPHKLDVSHHATQLHSFYFKSSEKAFYKDLGIYPANRLITELINFSQRWSHQFVDYNEPYAAALFSLYDVLPLMTEQQIKLQLPTSEHPKIEQVLQYIHQNFHTPLTLSEMTDQFHMSERSFCRLFKKELHISFIQYLKTYRIIQSISFLQKRKDYSIEQIANATGYESLAAFSNAFYEYTGMRPSQMRKMIT